MKGLILIWDILISRHHSFYKYSLSTNCMQDRSTILLYFSCVYCQPSKTFALCFTEPWTQKNSYSPFSKLKYLAFVEPTGLTWTMFWIYRTCLSLLLLVWNSTAKLDSINIAWSKGFIVSTMCIKISRGLRCWLLQTAPSAGHNSFLGATQRDCFVDGALPAIQLVSFPSVLIEQWGS